MDQLFEFIGNHPILVGTFVLLIFFFIRNETQRGGRGVTAQQLVDMVNREDAVVLDVREKKDYDEGHIVDAINVPFSALETRIDELKKYREGDWNELTVTVRDGVAHATCNGELLTDSMSVPETGPIGLEGDRGQMEYRRIRIKPLNE